MNDIKDNLEDLGDDIEDKLEDLGDDVEEWFDKLKQERDELKVQLRLARMEASDEWQELEKKWSKLEAKAKQVGNAAADSSGDIRAAAGLLGQEIKAGFKRIAKQL